MLMGFFKNTLSLRELTSIALWMVKYTDNIIDTILIKVRMSFYMKLLYNNLYNISEWQQILFLYMCFKVILMTWIKPWKQLCSLKTQLCGKTE